ETPTLKNHTGRAAVRQERQCESATLHKIWARARRLRSPSHLSKDSIGRRGLRPRARSHPGSWRCGAKAEDRKTSTALMTPRRRFLRRPFDLFLIDGAPKWLQGCQRQGASTRHQNHLAD